MKSLVLIVALFCLSCERHQTAPADVEPVDAVSPSTSDVVVSPVDATVSDASVSVDASVTDVVARDGG